MDSFIDRFLLEILRYSGDFSLVSELGNFVL